MVYSRRALWTRGVPLLAGAALGPRAVRATDNGVYDAFPGQDPQRISDTVLHAHSDLDALRTLVDASPALANAAVDWGFGDWESAIGAASHMGRRDIAEFLMSHGARPDLFTHAMLGHLDVVRATLESQPGIQGRTGPHGFTLMQHAQAGGEESKGVVAFLLEVGGASPSAANEPLIWSVDAYVGRYVFGRGERDVVEIRERNGKLFFESRGGFPRSLFHTGDNVFHPGGAASVRIAFHGDEGRASSLTVHDPDLQIRAERA